MILVASGNASTNSKSIFAASSCCKSKSVGRWSGKSVERSTCWKRIDFFAIDTVPLPYDYQLTNIYQSNQLQLGVKGQTALTYTPLKWLTLYSQFNFSGYLVSRAIQMNYNNDFVSDFGISQRPNFPSRLHSSLTFGVGINF